MSLNFAAFARWMHSPERLAERALGKLIAAGNPFFQIESLYRFNAKFFPRWEPRYLVYQGRSDCRGRASRRCGRRANYPSRNCRVQLPLPERACWLGHANLLLTKGGSPLPSW
jgi:hypothetical protein